MSTEPGAYDVFPYPGYVRPQTHPARLGAVGRLFGMAPAAVGDCRVLEIGCGDGVNLIGAAASLPDADFVGVDLASAPLESAMALAAAAGIGNVAFGRHDLAELPGDLGRFDFVIAHGVYSWVPPKVRAALLAACREHLNPGGIAYVSYNAYPGSHLRDMAREILGSHVRGVSEPSERLRRARRLMHEVVAADYPSPDARVLREQMAEMLAKDDYLLLHDDLAEINTPVYFHEFASHARAHGLKFVAEADLADGYLARRQPGVAATLAQLPDVISREQHLDVIINRPFRQSLLCHEADPVSDRPDAARLGALQLATAARPESGSASLATGTSERFTDPAGRSVTTDDPDLKAALAELAAAWPGTVRGRDLCARADQRLSEAGIEPRRDRPRLERALLDSCLGGLIEVRTEAPPVALSAADRPATSRLARAQISRGEEIVTTLRATSVRLEDPGARALVMLLDGSRDREDVIEAIRQTDDARAGHVDETGLAAQLETALADLARLGLLEQ